MTEVNFKTIEPVTPASYRHQANAALSDTASEAVETPQTGETAILARPFVKWVGGKRGIIQALIDHLPATAETQIDRYYEPFTGGGALFFALQQRGQLAHVCLSDVNANLITAYRVIQSEPEALITALTIHAQNHSETHYYEIRQQHTLTDPIAQAARLLYLNRTCYNGLYRVNRRGEFNVPMGRYKNPNIIQAENIRACHRVLQGVTIEHHSFAEVAPPDGDRCFLYFDPPYHPSDDGSFTGYSKLGFTAADQTRLRDFALDLHDRGHDVMLSNSNAELIRELYDRPPFRVLEINAPRLVNCKSSRRQAVGELLITTYPAGKLR